MCSCNERLLEHSPKLHRTCKGPVQFFSHEQALICSGCQWLARLVVGTRSSESERYGLAHLRFARMRAFYKAVALAYHDGSHVQASSLESHPRPES